MAQTLDAPNRVLSANRPGVQDAAGQARLSARVGRYGAVVIAFLVVAAYSTWAALGVRGGDLGQLENLFNMGSESNVPTWIATLLLFSAALAAWRLRDTYVGRPGTQPTPRWWAALSALFVYLSFDETARVHERVGVSVKGIVPDVVVLRHAWVLPGTILALVVGLVFLRFLAMVPVRLRISLILGGSLFLVGAVGFEIIDGFWQGVVGPNAWFRFSVNVIEESAELSGALVCLTALLAHAEDLSGSYAPSRA